MKYPALLCVSLFMAATASQAAVDPVLLGLVMPDAAVVGGVQVEQSQASPFGRYLISQFQPMADRDRLLALTGFDPQRDLREIVVAATTNQQALVIGHGVFQPGKITTAALSGGAKVSNYRGIDVINDAGAKGSVAFLDASTVAMGTADAVKAVIDRRVTSAMFQGDLADRARNLAASNDAWVVSNVPATTLAQGKIPLDAQQRAQFLQNIQQFSGGIRFGSDTVTINGQAKMTSDKDAQALADVLRFLAGMAQGNDPKLTAIASAARFSADGSVTSVTLSIPEADAEKLVAPKARPSARPAPRVRQ